MDIFKNWREGKKKHDQRVDKDLVDKFYQTLLPPPDINTASILIREISELRRRKEIDKESLLWKTLGDYALGMADLQSMAKEETNVTIKGADLVVAMERANNRKDTLNKPNCPHAKCECGVQPNGDAVYCNPNAAKAHVDAISKASTTQYGQTRVVGNIVPNSKHCKDIPATRLDPYTFTCDDMLKGIGRVAKGYEALNARVKRQDPLKEELRERRENGVINE